MSGNIITLIIAHHTLQHVIPVYSGGEVELTLTVFNGDGLMFDNFTSLKWDWKSSSHAHLSTNDVINLDYQGNHGNHFTLYITW